MSKPHVEQQLLDYLVLLCSETNSPFSIGVRLLAENRQVEDLLTLKVDPRNYESAAAYYRDAVISEFLRKYPHFDLGRDLKAEAVSIFFENEHRCAVTNQWMKKLYVQDRPLDALDVRMIDFLSLVRKNVSTLLGSIPRELVGRFGKGSTFGDVGQYVTVPDKMSSRPTCTYECRAFLPFWGGHTGNGMTAWYSSLCASSPHSEPLTVRGNRFTSVPKTAVSERGICIEPSLNVFWQLAVGTHIKEHLKRKFGYDLYTAQDRHRSMAREASLTGRWATIDLKNASDLFSYWFVRMVLPDDWFDLVSSLRSPYSEVNGQWVLLEKFSSMGNGFTFELMTVILTGICLTLSGDALRGTMEGSSRDGTISFSRDGNISIFGDDIICRPEIASLLINCLPAVGLMVNEKKTFLSGPFRESCGGDFFAGIDVRAYNLQESLNEPSRYIVLANAVRRLGRQNRSGFSGFSDYRLLWFRILDAIPRDVRRLRGPEFLGDLVVHDSDAHWQSPPRKGKGPTYRRTPDGRSFVRGWVPVYRKLRLTLWSPETQLAAALYGVPSSGPTPRKSGRDQVVGYRKRWLALGL